MRGEALSFGGTVSRWPARTSRRARPSAVRATTLSPTLTTSSPSTRSSTPWTWSAIGPSFLDNEGMATSSTVAASEIGSDAEPLNAYPVFSQHLVQLRRSVPLTLLQPTER